MQIFEVSFLFEINKAVINENSIVPGDGLVCGGMSGVFERMLYAKL